MCNKHCRREDFMVRINVLAKIVSNRDVQKLKSDRDMAILSTYMKCKLCNTHNVLQCFKRPFGTQKTSKLPKLCIKLVGIGQNCLVRHILGYKNSLGKICNTFTEK